MARSRHSKLETIDGDQYETFSLKQTNFFREPDTFAGIKTREYTVKRGDRLDHLAARFLNDDKYWWAIALVSNLSSPFLTPRQKIRIPLTITDVLDRM